jgi:hypothetical protein
MKNTAPNSDNTASGNISTSINHTTIQGRPVSVPRTHCLGIRDVDLRKNLKTHIYHKRVILSSLVACRCIKLFNSRSSIESDDYCHSQSDNN